MVTLILFGVLLNAKEKIKGGVNDLKKWIHKMIKTKFNANSPFRNIYVIDCAWKQNTVISCI